VFRGWTVGFVAALAACVIPATGVAGRVVDREARASSPLAPGIHLVARPKHRVLVLRGTPHGAALVRLGRHALFGGPTVLGVVRRRGNWLAVTSELLPNGRLGWVRAHTDVSLSIVRYAIHIDLSERRLVVMHDGRVARTIRVAVGSPASPTPPGRFAVAEKLAVEPGSVYGCCILGLTEHQPNPPAGWNRSRTYFVGIHGGGGIGSAVSAGCFHAAVPDLRYLMRTIPLGTPVVVRR